MRFLAIAAVTLGGLSVSYAVSSCKPTAATASREAATTDKITKSEPSTNPNCGKRSSHVQNELDFGHDGSSHTSSNAPRVPVGVDVSDSAKIGNMLSPSVAPTSTLTSKSMAVDGTLKKRQASSGTITVSLKDLVVASKYTLHYYYYVTYNLQANNCRIQSYLDNTLIGGTPYFAISKGVSLYNSWSDYNATAIPTATSGTLAVAITCTNGTAQAYIDSVTFTKDSGISTGLTTQNIATSTATALKSTIAAIPIASTTRSATSTLSTSIVLNPVNKVVVTYKSTTTNLSAKSSSPGIATTSRTTSNAIGSIKSNTSGSRSLYTTIGSAMTSPGSGLPFGSSMSTNNSAPWEAEGFSMPSTTSPAGTVPSAASSSRSRVTVNSTILIIAGSSDVAATASLGLIAYGIPYQLLIVPKEGVSLPVLNSSLSQGNFGGMIVMSSVAYEYSYGWASGITPEQWTVIYNYQIDFKIRMVRINEYPGFEFGVTTAGGGCCDSSTDQLVSLTNVSDFPTANLKNNAGVSTAGLWHVPAIITDPSTTRQVAKFGVGTGFSNETVAGVINNFQGREQLVWFMPWAPSWSLASSYLQHAHIHWMTRGVFLGKRKTYLSCQVDDLQIPTSLYYPVSSTPFKITIADLEAHVAWQKSLNSRLPAGSAFALELAHNGNGNIVAATALDKNGTCSPNRAIYYSAPASTDLEYQKPLGTGSDAWPSAYEAYSWTLRCLQLDSFASWFMVPANRDQFFHVSHTFTHLSLNNATYHDVNREIQFNKAWFTQTGIDQSPYFSKGSIVPPAITGLHNGDAIKAWMDNGLTSAVGDNTRPVLRNTNIYWPLTSTVAGNGYAGLTIVPRFSTAIYFNCNSAACTTQQWISPTEDSDQYSALLAQSKTTNVRNLLALMADPYMFHQANMNQVGVDKITVGSQTGQMSLVMSWTETVAQEMARLTNWPILSSGNDDLAKYFNDRQTLDNCQPTMSYSYSADGTSITQITVSAAGNNCPVPIPITIPSGSSTASGGSATSDVVGSEPPIQWVTLRGSPVTLTLSSPISVS